jgi:hypothetical protein
MEFGQKVANQKLIVKRVFFSVPLKPSGTLMLAELDDERLCIVKNDEPLSEWCWQQTEMHKAVKRFQEMKGELAMEAKDAKKKARARDLLK